MRLSFYTYSYTDRQDMSIPECLARIAKTGYAGIDESATFGRSTDPKSVTPERRKLIFDTAKKENLKIEAVVTHEELTNSLGTATPLDLKGTVDLAADLGCPVVTFHMGGPIKEMSEKDLWWKVVEVLKDAGAYGDSKHVSLAIDLGVWPSWITSTPDLLAKMFSDVNLPSFGVNLDPAYLAINKHDPVRFVKRFGPRIRHAHLKDTTGEYKKLVEHIPGQGMLDYVPIFAALKEAEFTGALAVECFVSMKFEEACDEGYKAMAEAMRKAGVKL